MSIPVRTPMPPLHGVRRIGPETRSLVKPCPDHAVAFLLS